MKSKTHKNLSFNKFLSKTFFLCIVLLIPFLGFEETKSKLKGSMTYTIKGKANEKEKLLKSILKAKASALKFYNLKNRN